MSGSDPRLGGPPLPEVVRALHAKQAILRTAGKRQCGLTALGQRRGTVVERNLEEDHLHGHHEERLHEQTYIEARAGPVVDSAIAACQHRRGLVDEAIGGTDLSKEATSMMRGMSREKPALDLLRCIEMAWSL